MRHRIMSRFAVIAAAALAATILTPVGPAAADEFSVVVEATDSERFTASDNWQTSSWSDQRYGDEYYFASPDTSASDAAWYAADIPEAGTYRVEVWYPANSGYNNRTPFVVATADGSQTVHVNQRGNGGQWVNLGVFPLAAGDDDVVAVSRWTTGEGYVIADAIRISEAAGSGDDEWSLPVPDDFFPRSEYERTHHTYPAIDLRTPTGTPARAVRAGTVTRIDDGSCGLGMSLAGTDGATYNYCHFSAWSVPSGTTVVPGQQIGLTGNTGHSTGPHLHLQIRTPDGALRCPQNLLLAIYDGVTPPAANTLPTSGCTH
jgi:murein DD-endopeptidase MepM/ murein hydrolase activator NlpD